MTNKLIETFLCEFPTTNRLVERSALELENFIVRLHDAVAHRSPISVPWAPFTQLVTEAYIPAVMREVRKAFESRAMFAVENPAWSPLPLGSECNALIRATGAMHLLGLYSFSLQLMGYDYFGHPRFHTFGCGVMAHSSVPEHVRDDIELQEEFPARELPGLDGRLLWFGESLQPGERLLALGRHISFS
jgi:hypothetical protein